MDGLRVLAREELDRRLDFRARSNPITMMTVMDQGDGLQYRTTTGTEDEIASIIEASSAISTGPEVKPALIVVVLPRYAESSIDCSKAHFLWLLDFFRIDPFLLRSVAIGASGLQYDGKVYASRYSYHIGAFCYALLWSFDPNTMHTNAILMPRGSFWARVKQNPVTEIGRVVILFRQHIHTPFFLAFITQIHLSQRIEELVYRESTLIRDIERRTLHSSPGFGKTDLSIDQLSAVLQLLDDTLSLLSDHIRHLAVVDELIEFLEAGCHNDKALGIPKNLQEHHDQDLAAFAPTLPVLRKQNIAMRSAAEFFRERAKNQYSVTFALLTHEDARIGIAQAEASRELAQAAKEDSSAMKVISVMTMLFLPGTFFATLFPVPSLRWDLPVVVQKNFWVYWVFTLPATVIIFAVWIFLSQWPPNGMRAKIRSLANSSNNISKIEKTA